jgi:hypothetical protein
MSPPDLTQARAALRSHYEEWRSLSIAEGEAIRAGQWAQVEQLQARKRQLQEFVAADLGELPVAERDRLRAEFRLLVDELLALESRNREDLARQREQLATRQQRTDQIALRLRQLRQSYGVTGVAAWQSYS